MVAYGETTIAQIPENGIGIMDRGFASVERIKELNQKEDRYFVLRIKNNVTLEMLENSQSLVGVKGKRVEVRVVNFCSLDSRSEYRLATNLEPQK